MKVRIAACLIVKDEAAVLEQCIGSFRPHVDEICVYDTGSTDGTPELAARLGCRVDRGAWRDDFAWARQQSFDMASPESAWLMWIDAGRRARRRRASARARPWG